MPVADSNQINLFAEEQNQTVGFEPKRSATTNPVGAKTNRLKRQPKRMALPADLPRQQQVIEPAHLPQGSKKIGEQITEYLEYI